MAKVMSRPFGVASGGQPVVLYTLSNGTTEVDISNYGATMVAIRTPGADGMVRDVLLGYDDVTGYETKGQYLGAVIGRNGNRIKNSEFEINRKHYQMTPNEGANNLHSGPNGFESRIWNAGITANENGEALEFTLFSPDGDQGFPGNLQVCVRYSLTDDSALVLEYFAKTDADTVVNLTNHSYFNLNGNGSGTILNHRLKLYADFYTPVDETCCPNGEILSVKGTVFDFTDFKVIGEEIDRVPDFAATGGYDHNFILRTKERQMTLGAQVVGDQSGILMEMYTNQPAVQFYAGNAIADVTGKAGFQHAPRVGFCLETQCPPNALANPHFPSPILRAGDVYNYTTIYKFSAC